VWIGSGGDAVKGTRFADLVPLFKTHAETAGLMVIGEIGGTEEEELADALMRERFSKPVFALLARPHPRASPWAMSARSSMAPRHRRMKIAALARPASVHTAMRRRRDVARLLAPTARSAQSA
jgi:succinyl-CoA synthetase alpha subunit